MNNISKILGENNLSFEEFVYYNDGWIITNAINWKQPFPYFKLYIGDQDDMENATDIGDKNKTPMCRISMMESKYIGAEGETLKLNKNEKEKLTKILNSVNEETGDVIWKLLIGNYNYFHINDDNATQEMINSFKEIPLNLPIPDYKELSERDLLLIY